MRYNNNVKKFLTAILEIGLVTPIVVNGVMYLTAGNRVLALDPDTGKEIWRYDVQNGQASQREVVKWRTSRAIAITRWTGVLLVC